MNFRENCPCFGVSMETKIEKLRSIIASYESVLVAFSGGADSALVLKVARDVLGKDRAKAVTARSPSLSSREFEGSVRFAKEIDAEQIIVETDECERPEYRSNPPDRCYFCKETLYERMREIARAAGSKTIANGANADDLSDWRPGMRAARDFSVASPLLEAGFFKADVRECSKRLGLPTWDKEASPCLASRIPYGEEVTPEKLSRIERAEDHLKDFGFSPVRVRHHGPVARIEVLPAQFEKLSDPELAARIVQTFRRLGFDQVSLDLAGFRSGSLNDAISITVERKGS